MSQPIDAEVEVVLRKKAPKNGFHSNYPNFLTENYFEKILRKINRDQSMIVESIDVGPCGAAGDAFASTMYRVEVKVILGTKMEVKRGKFIVKMMPTSQLARDKLGEGSYDVHEKEMDIFQTILPEFTKVLRPIHEDKNVFPKAIAIDRLKGVIVLEDLADRKFIMANRKVGLGVEQLKMALKKLAKFHAASMVVIDKKPKLFQHYDVGMFSRKTSAFHDFFTSNMDALTAEVSSWTGFEIYAKKLKALRPNFLENAFKVFDNDDNDDMKVLVHGDLWVNNLMYQYDKQGNLKDAILLDFQFCCIAHPAVDLLYFLYTSAIDQVRQSRIQGLIQFYFYELKSVLINLGYDTKKVPTLHQFQVQVLRKYFYAFPSLMVIFPLMMSNDPDANFENSHQTNEKALAFKRRLYKNPDLQKIIKNSLPKFDRLGLLDEM